MISGRTTGGVCGLEDGGREDVLLREWLPINEELIAMGKGFARGE